MGLRGFAAMSLERRREIASKGGRRAHELGTAHQFTTEEARAAGKKGGVILAKNRAWLAEIGRRGGKAVQAKKRAQAASSAAAERRAQYDALGPHTVDY